LFLGFKSIICFIEEGYSSSLGLLASSSWLFMCSSMALFNGINSPGFLLGGWCALIVFSPCHCSAPFQALLLLRRSGCQCIQYSRHSTVLVLCIGGFRVPLIRCILRYFLI
jgi:hypothetical protein